MMAPRRLDQRRGWRHIVTAPRRRAGVEQTGAYIAEIADPLAEWHGSDNSRGRQSTSGGEDPLQGW
jgi:hypothetical protein